MGLTWVSDFSCLRTTPATQRYGATPDYSNQGDNKHTGLVLKLLPKGVLLEVRIQVEKVEQVQIKGQIEMVENCKANVAGYFLLLACIKGSQFDAFGFTGAGD